MIRTVCDSCDKPISRVRGGWLGVDCAHLDDDGELVQFDDDHQYHFCSLSCLQAWSFGREFGHELSEGTTA